MALLWKCLWLRVSSDINKIRWCSCSVSAPSLVWVSSKDEGTSCSHSPQWMDSYHYLSDAKSTYYLEFILISFLLIPKIQKQWLSVSWKLISGICPRRGHYILSLSWKSFQKIFTELFPVIIWVWFKCLSSEMPFLTTPPHVLPMSLIPEIQMKENKIPSERSLNLNMA